MSQWEIGERRGESYGGAGTFIQGDIKGCGKFFLIVISIMQNLPLHPFYLMFTFIIYLFSCAGS